MLVLLDSIGTLGARDFSCAVSGFGQVLKSDPREKPLDQSAIPFIAPSQLQHRLYQNIQNMDVLLIGSLEVNKISACGVAVFLNLTVCDVCVLKSAVFGETKLSVVSQFPF